MEKDYEEKMTFVFPLINFETEREAISIDNDLEIRLLDDNERQYLRKHRGLIEVTRPWLPRYCLQITEKDTVPAVKKAYPVISALRLLKPHLIGINGFFISNGPPEVDRFTGLLEVDALSRRINEGIFSATEKDIFDFLCLYGDIVKILEKERKLSFALARLNMAYSSKWLETRLLDYIIALESLYLPGESEKAFRLCCYMTFTLSSGSEESSKAIWNYVHTAYQMRSRVIHGSGSLPLEIPIGKGKDKTTIPIEQFIEKIEKYTRQSIRRFLEKEKKVEKVQSDLRKELIKKIGINIGLDQ